MDNLKKILFWVGALLVLLILWSLFLVSFGNVDSLPTHEQWAVVVIPASCAQYAYTFGAESPNCSDLNATMPGNQDHIRISAELECWKCGGTYPKCTATKESLYESCTGENTIKNGN